ncbi:hypothetical protein [Streptomyces sp. NPDC056660]|uniref:hypothetical protein n=1 Tax=Streptomyces sp. NPDC056660 TaxID=3345897 RepID=UPI00368DA022
MAAVADVRRQVARAEKRAVSELLAAEWIRTRLSGAPPTASAFPASTAAERVPDQGALL